MPNLEVQIVRFLGWDPQPGIVEFVLIDAEGQKHTFVDKIPIISEELLDEASEYPRPAHLACEVLTGSTDEFGQDRVRVTTLTPWGVESVAGLSEFVVLASQLRGDGKR